MQSTQLERPIVIRIRVIRSERFWHASESMRFAWQGWFESRQSVIGLSLFSCDTGLRLCAVFAAKFQICCAG